MDTSNKQVIDAFLKLYSQPNSTLIDAKSLLNGLEPQYVSATLEPLLSNVFDKKTCPKQLANIGSDLKKNKNLHMFYNALRVLYQSGHLTNIKYLTQLFMEKRNFIQTLLLENLHVQTGMKIKTKVTDSILNELVLLYLGHKASFAFARLNEASLSARKIDMTKEISDANSFFIEGYSLVAQCFQGHFVDWSSGGQYLHLVYLFEKYIEMFSSLTEFFTIVFFGDLNALFLSNSSFYLAVSVIFNHLTTLKKYKIKIEFFDSMFAEKYVTFLDQEKPTFMVINDNSMHKLGASHEIRNELKSVYSIFKIYHAKHDMKFMLLNELMIKSNRLNGFYGMFREDNIKKYMHTLENLNYEQDFATLIEHQAKLKTAWKAFDKSIFNKSVELIKQMTKKVGPKLTYYCTALAWCYTNNRLVSDKVYGSLVFAMVSHCYLQDNVDFRLRGLRIKPLSDLSKDEENFLDNFKGKI